ncbi:hypothetical protein [Nitrospirillum viridazoti]|uniref:Uncharacterized protein n=1 Tax=Nitrospirillum amazonense TaxID=28077 RepID=A0A560INI2_9PROT|nr:hypothetical protein [Nitrospirillum amazonense]TWB58714.1 hypothetical protein FBZ92_109207 [Nitrospirillum amazonense]
MARKPVHLTATVKSPGGRQAMWEAMRRLRRFTVDEVAKAAGAEHATVLTYVMSLNKGGYLTVAGTLDRTTSFRAATGSQRAANIYEIANDVGFEAPRVRRDGSPCTQGAPREQMWRTMKMLGDFTYRDLAVAASTEAHPVNEVDAQSYCMFLGRANYLVVVAEAKKGKGRHSLTRYRFVKARDTGPLAPMVQRVKSVFDPNKREIVWHEAVDE